MMSKKAVSMSSDGFGVTHVHLDVFSINIIRTDAGVAVSIWEKDFKGPEPIGGTYVSESELENNDE
jgi:hypothetical protein